MCGSHKADPCTSWQPVSKSHVDDLVDSGIFQCPYDWPPWPEHLTPHIHNSPPGFANLRDGLNMWHDVAAALTLETDAGKLTHNVWMGSYPYGGFQGYPFLGKSGYPEGNAWQRASSTDFVHWENHGNSLGRLTGFAIQDPSTKLVCAAQRGGCEFWTAAGGCSTNVTRNMQEHTPISMTCAKPSALDGAHAWSIGGPGSFVFTRPYHTADGDGQGWQDEDGHWSIAIAATGCGTGDPPPMPPSPPCLAGGGLELWRSPKFGLSGHDWKMMGMLAVVNTSMMLEIEPYIDNMHAAMITPSYTGKGKKSKVYQ